MQVWSTNLAQDVCSNDVQANKDHITNEAAKVVSFSRRRVGCARLLFNGSAAPAPSITCLHKTGYPTRSAEKAKADSIELP